MAALKETTSLPFEYTSTNHCAEEFEIRWLRCLRFQDLSSMVEIYVRFVICTSTMGPFSDDRVTCQLSLFSFRRI
jgi:hypothetical protein